MAQTIAESRSASDPTPASRAGNDVALTLSDNGSASPWAVLREMVGELIEYRELLLQFAWRNIRVRYKQAIFGFAWALFMPALVVSAGLIIKFVMAHAAGVKLHNNAFAAIAVKALPWAFFVGVISTGGTSVAGASGFITKIYFPREVLPLSALLTQAFDSVIGAAAMAVILFGFLGLGVSWQMLWIIPLTALLIVLTVGVVLFLSCAHLFFRDVKYLVQVVVMFGVFFTPVLYEASDLGVRGASLIMLNPVAPILEGLRLAVVEHHNLLIPLQVASKHGALVTAWHPLYLVYTAVIAVLGTLGASLLFHKLEFIYAEYA